MDKTEKLTKGKAARKIVSYFAPKTIWGAEQNFTESIRDSLTKRVMVIISRIQPDNSETIKALDWLNKARNTYEQDKQLIYIESAIKILKSEGE